MQLDAAMLIIEHDMPLIMGMSDRVYCLEAGSVIAAGDPRSVRDDPAVIASYLGTDERTIQRSGAVGEALRRRTASAYRSTPRRATRDDVGAVMKHARGRVAPPRQPKTGSH